MSKLIGLGMKGWNALDDKAFDKDDVEGLRALLETAGGELGKRVKPKAASAAAAHLALVTRAFGQALGRHSEHHGYDPLPKKWRLWRNKPDAERTKEIELRSRLAAPKICDLGVSVTGDLEQIDALRGSPLGTPYYRALWWAFAEAKLTDTELGEEPLLDMTDTAAREFERFFLLAYMNGLAAAPAIDEYLGGLAVYRSVLVRDLILRDMATWGDRHVFGNVRREQWEEGGQPFLPMDAMYVEPSASVEERRVAGVRAGEKSESSRPVLELLRELVSSKPARIIVVTADFGHGKSLSARRLACELAKEFLREAQPSPLLTMPAYVRCAEDFSSEKLDPEETLRRAWKRTASTAGYDVAISDPAFTWPDDKQRFLYLLDGLDEVTLGASEVHALLQKLGDKTSADHRFVIFTRPGALPADDKLPKNVTLVRLASFTEAHIQDWVSKWNALAPRDAQPSADAISYEAMVRKGLAELAATPILLFMIASTWNDHAGHSAKLTTAQLYEHFFLQLARGKAERDRDKHPHIHEASEKLCGALQKASVLPQGTPASEAMLWLMSRVAWEAIQLEQRKARALEEDDVLRVLRDELDQTETATLDLIRLGLVLALQANLRSDRHTILFGHHSFREFLVARYWAHVLRCIARSKKESEQRKLSTRLLGARLLGEEDKAFAFLMELINEEGNDRAGGKRWSDKDREALVEWAEEEFNNESLSPTDEEAPLRTDQRIYLREAALAIGSMTQRPSVTEGEQEPAGLKAREERTLRSLLASFWLRGEHARIFAPRARLENAELEAADLTGADLRGANLQGANLQVARLLFARLQSANLRGADLRGAYLVGANLQGANLHGADLQGANFRGAYLQGATFGSQTQLPDGSIHYNDATYDASTIWPEGFTPQPPRAQRAVAPTADSPQAAPDDADEGPGE